jgi:hypothetical protein
MKEDAGRKASDYAGMDVEAARRVLTIRSPEVDITHEP